MTVSRAIASAGGLSRDAVDDQVTIYRRKGTKTELIPVSLSKIKATPAEDVILNPYDIVDVAQKGRGNRRFPPRMDPESERTTRLNLAVRVVD
jgi:protein involved in polysaccharide export with SLBB domain